MRVRDRFRSPLQLSQQQILQIEIFARFTCEAASVISTLRFKFVGAAILQIDVRLMAVCHNDLRP